MNAFSWIQQFDVLVVIGAGNGIDQNLGPRNDSSASLPAALSIDFPDTVITVTSHGIDDPRIANWHATGSAIDVAAPGWDMFVDDGRVGNCWNATCVNRYRRSVGTSQSAPVVSGIAGLLLSLDPSLTASELKTCIVEGAETYGEQSRATQGSVHSGLDPDTSAGVPQSFYTIRRVDLILDDCVPPPTTDPLALNESTVVYPTANGYGTISTTDTSPAPQSFWSTTQVNLTSFFGPGDNATTNGRVVGAIGETVLVADDSTVVVHERTSPATFTELSIPARGRR